MQISWYGKSFLKIVSKESTIAVAPYDEKGVKISDFEADLLLSSEGKSSSVVKGKPFVINTPGEFEVHSVFVHALGQKGVEKKNHLLFRFEVNGISVAHLGDLSTMPSKKNLEDLQGIDVLVLPVGGKSVLDSKKAVELVHAVEPRVVIPVFYKVENLKDDLAPVADFVKGLGTPMVEPVEKVKLKANQLPQDQTQLILLEPLV